MQKKRKTNVNSKIRYIRIYYVSPKKSHNKSKEIIFLFFSW